jgi:hypothetical protein
MKPKDIFLLAVRLLGLIFLYHGLMSVPAAMELFRTRTFASYFIGFVLVLWPLAVAWWLIGGAPLVMNLAYPEVRKEDSEPGSGLGERLGP